MAHVRATQQSSEPIHLQPLHEISLRVQLESEIIENASVVRVVFLQSPPKCLQQKSGFDRTTVQFAEESRLSSSVPTSMLFDFQYNKSEFVVSYATLILFIQIQVCCIDRLNPQPHSSRSKL